MDKNGKGFWFCWIDGELWLMFGPYKVSRQIINVEALDLLLGRE